MAAPARPKFVRHFLAWADMDDEIRADFDLGAQAAVRTINKVCDAYATLRGNIRAGNLDLKGAKRRERAESKPIAFRDDAARPFDDRIPTWNLDQRTVSTWTMTGRLNQRLTGSSD